MDYKKLISTLGRSNMRYAIINGELAVCNRHIIIYIPRDSLPSALQDIATELSDTDVITRHQDLPHDNAVFTGVTFVKGTRTIMVFMAEDHGRKYPVFLDKRYIDLLGGDPIAIYGTGDSLKPLYYAGKTASAYIYPMRITNDDVRKVVSVVGEIQRSLTAGIAPRIPD